MERLRTVTVTVEIDTNKRTETETFTLADYEATDAVFAAAEGWAIDVLREM
jgi:hypothetical protein